MTKTVIIPEYQDREYESIIPHGRDSHRAISIGV